MPTPPPAQLAAEWMAHWGEQDPEATSDVTVHAAEAVALVCCGVTVGRAELNDLVEYASSTDHMRRLYLFADRRFGGRTVSMADELQVALFRWDERGALHPVGALAEHYAGTAPADVAPTGGKRRAQGPVDGPVDGPVGGPTEAPAEVSTVADRDPALDAEPAVEQGGPAAVDPNVAAEVAAEPRGGRRRAAMPVDSAPAALDPVLFEAAAPLTELALPTGQDPLFAPIEATAERPAVVAETNAPEQSAEAIDAAGGDTAWGSWTEYIPADTADPALDDDEVDTEDAPREAVDRTHPGNARSDSPDSPDSPDQGRAPTREQAPAATDAPTTRESAVVTSPEPIEVPAVAAPIPARPAPVAPAAKVATPGVGASETQASQIERYLDLLHNRAAVPGVGASRRGPAPTASAPEMPEAPPAPEVMRRRFADPTRQVAGGPDRAARSAATRPAGPIEGLTPDMIFPRQQPAPAQESLPSSGPQRPAAAEPEPTDAVEQLPSEPEESPRAHGSAAETPERSRRGWFSRRNRAETAAEARATATQRSYQMRRTLEARRVMLETGLPPVTDFPEAMDWLRQGDRARAIALYRKTVGVGLVEAIDAIDALGGEY